MKAINRVLLVGNLTRDPELTHTKGGTSVAKFGMAVNGRVKEGDDWVDRADFFDVTAYGHQAEAIHQYLARGKPVAVDGRLKQERWTNKENENRSKVVIEADTVQFLGDGNGGGRDRDADPPSPAEQPDFDPGTPAPDDDLPF